MHHTFVLRAWIRPKLNSTIYVIFSNNKDIMDIMGSRVYVDAASSLTNAEHVSVHRGSESAVCLWCTM